MKRVTGTDWYYTMKQEHLLLKKSNSFCPLQVNYAQFCFYPIFP